MKKYNTISYLRIIAFLLVIRGHYCSIFELPSVFGKFIITGAGPVVLFFVLSGFLAFDALEKRSVMQYYAARVKRILPPYYLVLVLCIVFLVTTSQIQPDTTKLGWFRYFSFTNMLIPSYSYDEWNNLYGYWTMGCFPIFYMLAPILYKWMKSLRSSIACFLCSVILMFVASTLGVLLLQRTSFDIGGYVSVMPTSTLYLFVMGMMSAYAYKNGYVQEMAMFFGIFLLSMLALGKSGYVLWGGATGIILLKPSISFSLEKCKVWCTLTAFLDRNSFNIYLLHLLVADICIYFTKTNNVITCIISVIIVLVVSELLSKLTTLLVKRRKTV